MRLTLFHVTILYNWHILVLLPKVTEDVKNAIFYVVVRCIHTYFATIEILIDSWWLSCISIWLHCKKTK